MTAHIGRIDQFLLMHSARADQWRELTGLAARWAQERGERAAVEAALTAMTALEEFHAYPGARLLGTLRECIAENDATGCAALARRISNAILTRSYRERSIDWDAYDETSADEVAEILPPGLGERQGHRPYFEVLFVSAQPAARWPILATEIRRTRRVRGCLCIRGGFRRFVRGRVLRGGGEPRDCSRRACGGLPVSIPPRYAGAALHARPARGTRRHRERGADIGRRLEAYTARVGHLPAIRP